MFIFVDKIAFTVSPRVNQLQNSQMDSEIVVVPRRRWQQISTQRMYYLSLVDDSRDAGRMCILLDPHLYMVRCTAQVNIKHMCSCSAVTH